MRKPALPRVSIPLSGWWLLPAAGAALLFWRGASVDVAGYSASVGGWQGALLGAVLGHLVWRLVGLVTR